jgi:hypothetical protein
MSAWTLLRFGCGVEDGQHVGEQRAIAPSANADAAPINKSDLDRRIGETGWTINHGHGEESGCGGERLRRRCFAMTVAFGDGPSPGVEGMFVQAMTTAVIADAEPASTLLVDVTTPKLLMFGAGLSRHDGLR